jgi:hypothetical protein
MNKTKEISNPEQEPKKMLLMGTTRQDLNLDFLRKAAWAALPKKHRTEENVYTIRSYFEDMQPQNPIEGMVYSNLYALYAHAMALMADSHTLSIDLKEQKLKLSSKLLKNFSELMVSLQKFKSQGRQTIRVENVNISDGGQAIVGNFKNPNSDKGGI